MGHFRRIATDPGRLSRRPARGSRAPLTSKPEPRDQRRRQAAWRRRMRRSLPAGRVGRAAVRGALVRRRHGPDAKQRFIEEPDLGHELRDAVAAGKTSCHHSRRRGQQSGPYMALGKRDLRARVSLRADRPRPRQRAGRAGRGVCAEERPRPPDGAHAVSRHDLDPRRDISRDAQGAARSFKKFRRFKDVVLIGETMTAMKPTSSSSPTT